MVQRSEVALESLKEVPDHQRHQMVAGMRWTLWLSIVCAPLGYATTVLLARIGPQVIGTYGLLTLYIGLTSVFLFFGGNGVAIKFLPELEPEKRASFLVSYFLITIAATLPFQVAASIWPKGLKYVLGNDLIGWFGVLLVWLAPLYVLFSLVLAALKGLLEIKWAQIYARVITLSSFAVYAVLYFYARPFLAEHYSAIIWSVYLGPVLLLMFLGMRRLLSLLGKRHLTSSLRFFLPRGFWHYTIGLQANCTLDFLSSRLDYIFILNVASLAVFGRYVALLTLVSIIPIFATFVLDSFLPSLTNTLAPKDYGASRRLTEVYLRFMLPCGMLATTFATLFAHRVFGLLGPKYTDLVSLGLIAFPVGGIQVLNWFAGTMLTAIGKPHVTVAAKATRLIVFGIIFWPLWAKYHLLGAILAWGIGEVCDQIVLFWLLLRSMPFRFSFLPIYSAFLASICLSALAAHFLNNRWPLLSFGVWIALIMSFLLAARYSPHEIRDIAHMVLPSRISAFIPSFTRAPWT